MSILSVGSAFPPYVYEQEELLAALRSFWGQRHYNVERLERLHRNVLVGRRHLTLPLERYAELTDWGEANNLWIESATKLGTAAVDDALERAGLRAEAIDTLVFVTTTGVATPSLDALLMNRLPLRPDLHRVPLFGLGCAGGAAGLARAADLLRGAAKGTAVVLSVELCSLTIQREDMSVANLIGTGLFADGAAAAVLAAPGHDALGPRVVATRSVFYPDSEHVMGWDIGSSGFGLLLSADVPQMVEAHLGTDVADFLREHDLRVRDIERWICHPGGPKVLQAMQRTLELDDSDLAHSWEVLRDRGNLSSATTLLVLQMSLDDPPPAGSYAVLLALGPGFAAELLLLHWP